MHQILVCVYQDYPYPRQSPAPDTRHSRVSAVCPGEELSGNQKKHTYFMTHVTQLQVVYIMKELPKS